MGGEQSGNSVEIDYYTNSIDLVKKNLNTFTIPSYLAENIKYLNLAENEITSLPEDMSRVVLVNLTKNQMGPLLPVQVAKQITIYSKLKTFYLSNNKLEDLNDFLCNKSVETMFLSQNLFKQIPQNFFDRFPLVKTLYFDCNLIESFSNCKSNKLKSFYFSLNCLNSLDTATLSFTELQSLDLSKNSIEKVPKDFSKSFPKLNTLNLNYNKITEIPDNDSEDEVFPQTLKELKIKHNFIEKVPNSITSLQNLTNLVINNNNIKHLPALPPSLVTLDASSNAIESIDEMSLPNLKELDLSKNELRRFPVEIKTEVIMSLYVHHNKITEIDLTSLSSTISEIDFSFNQIEKIPKEIFELFPELQAITAFFNRITEIPAEIANCKCLSVFGISFNPIQNLPKLPRSITKISASNCQLNSFNEDAFADAKPITVTTGEETVTQEERIILKHADFSGNNLESFPEFESIEYLNLSQNSLKKLPKITNTLKVLDVSMNKIESLPNEVSGKSLVELNLSFNQIEKLPSIRFLPFLKCLELTSNPTDMMIDVTGNQRLERIDISKTKNVTFVNNSTVAHEVIYSKPNKEKVAPMKKAPILIIQKNKKSGYSEILGLRESMEDAIIIRDDLGLYAVCDGHGGSDTANFASIHLPRLFYGHKDQISFENAHELIMSIFYEMEPKLRNQNYDDGSTLCLCLTCTDQIGNQKVVTAHLGDARALIVRRDGKSRELTTDHKPSNREEFERIRNDRGKLSAKNRIDGTLAVARSIGDYSVFAVGREIDLRDFDLCEDDRYLVIGCDGVFDVLSNDDVALVASQASSPNQAAFAIRNAAYGCGSTDNISVVVVDLTFKY